MVSKEWRKWFAAFLAVLCFVSVLAGCRPDAGKETEPDRERKDDGRQEISLWYYWETESHQQAIDKVIRDYNASQDEIIVETRYVPFADFKKQLSIGASADELPDIAILDSADHASYASMGIFADLTGKFDTTGYYAQAVESCTLDEKLYGVPFGVNCLGLFYNQDLLAAAGCKAPATWEELKETALKLTGEGVTGLAFSALQNEEGTFILKYLDELIFLQYLMIDWQLYQFYIFCSKFQNIELHYHIKIHLPYTILAMIRLIP